MSEGLLFHMADTACVRAWEDEMWGPIHKKLLLMSTKREHPGFKRKYGTMTNFDVVLKHLNATGSISIREAMDDYQISGGTLTKVISVMKRNGYNIDRVFYTHPINNRRYARYFLRKIKVA